jgi:hypothetical protein
MSINTTIFLGLLLFFILQETLGSDQSNKVASNELNEKTRVKEHVIASGNDNKSERPQVTKEQDHHVDTPVNSVEKRDLSKKVQYRITPVVPSFSPDELNWKKQQLVLELFVNVHGDVERVMLKNMNKTDESDKIFQKLKPIFLNAKFYPYFDNGKAVPFRIEQPIEIEVPKNKSLLHKIFGENNH